MFYVLDFWELSVLFWFFLFCTVFKEFGLKGRWFFFAIAWDILVENLDAEKEKIVGFVLFSVVIHCVVE